MTARLAFEPDHLEISFPGADALLALKRSLQLPWTDIGQAVVMEQREAKQSLGIRIGGGYWPGWFATGHFTYRHRKGERQLWYCYRAKRVLAIDTHRPKPRRVVLQVDDPDALAARINALAADRGEQLGGGDAGVVER